MKRKTTSHAKVIILLCIALLMFNCQNEENSPDELQNKIETVNIDEAKNFLMNSKSNFSAKSTNDELEDLAFDKITQEKINGSDQLLTVIPFARNSDLEYKRILLLKIDNEIKSVVFSMYSDEGSIKGSFSGKLFAYSLDGTFINGFRVKNGIIVSQFFENASSALKTNIENGKIPTLTRRSPTQLNEVVVQNNYRNTVHALDMFGVDGMFNDFDSSTPYYSWDTGAGYSGVTVPTPLEIANALEKQIITDNLDPCPKDVLEKLKNAKNCDIANILTKLNANKTYNVIITSGNSGAVPATTSRISMNNYSIVISNDRYTSSTQLFKASILLHELGHAFFMSLVDDYDSSKNPAIFIEFPTLFQKYVDTKYPGGKAAAQHEEMANTYVEAIGTALQEFQTGISLPYGVKPDQVFTDLAWGGLRDADVYEKKFPVGTAERLRIDNRLASEQTGNTIGAGTPQQQTTIGKPCN